MMFARLAENGQIFTQLPSGLTSLCVLCTNHPGKLRNLNVIKSCESSIKGVFTVCVVFALLKELCQANFYTATSSTYSVELKTDALSFWLIDTFGRKTGWHWNRLVRWRFARRTREAQSTLKVRRAGTKVSTSASPATCLVPQSLSRHSSEKQVRSCETLWYTTEELIMPLLQGSTGWTKKWTRHFHPNGVNNTK